jgi:hypothetical protein
MAQISDDGAGMTLKNLLRARMCGGHAHVEGPTFSASIDGDPTEFRYVDGAG